MENNELAGMSVSIDGGPKVSLDLFEHAARLVRERLAARRGESTSAAADDLPIGHDSGGAEAGGVASDRLRSIVERIERLEEERKDLASDIKDIYAEAKSAGYDVKVLRQLIRIRKQEPEEVEDQEALLDVYRHALGM